MSARARLTGGYGPGRKGAGARKTVTFGDASEVKGSPSWSVSVSYTHLTLTTRDLV